MATVKDVVTGALIEIGRYAPGESLDANVAAFGLSAFNDLIDEWAALRKYAWSVGFNVFNLTANHGPHLIGPALTSPDIPTPNNAPRPQRIEGGTILLPSGATLVDVPINTTRDDDWWNNQRIKSLATNIPTDLFYSPDWPNGVLNFWPIPNSNMQCRLQLWNQLAGAASLNTVFNAPPAYRKAVKLTLAEDLTGPLQATLTPGLMARAAKARAAASFQNIRSPRTTSVDAGMPGGTRRGGFNYYTGM